MTSATRSTPPTRAANTGRSLLQINPHYNRDKSVSDLVRERVLHPSCNVVFADWELRTHQVQSVHIARERRSFVVTTGTGSGKSICFFLPIIDSVLRGRATDAQRRTRAIVVYPMNGLANSQVGELDAYFKEVVPQHRVTYRRYTGQEDQDERRRIAGNPPDILLTNFMMLELIGAVPWRSRSARSRIRSGLRMRLTKLARGAWHDQSFRHAA